MKVKIEIPYTKLQFPKHWRYEWKNNKTSETSRIFPSDFSSALRKKTLKKNPSKLPHPVLRIDLIILSDKKTMDGMSMEGVALLNLYKKGLWPSLIQMKS